MLWLAIRGQSLKLLAFTSLVNVIPPQLTMFRCEIATGARSQLVRKRMDKDDETLNEKKCYKPIKNWRFLMHSYLLVANEITLGCFLGCFFK